MANLVHLEGLEWLAKLFLGQQQIPDNFFIGLATNITLTVNSSLTSISEPSGYGYERVPIPSNEVGFPTSRAIDSGWELITTPVSFTPMGGSWPTVYYAFLCTSPNSEGVLIGSFSLKSPIALTPGDQEIVAFHLILKSGIESG